MDSPLLTLSAETRDLRRAFACFATGVTIVTLTNDTGVDFGMTVSSFTPLSLEPALVAWAIQKSSSVLTAVRDAPQFAINVLGDDHGELSDRFAGKGDRRLATDDYFVTKSGCPVLSDAIASFECTKYATHDVGDHLLIVGKVSGMVSKPFRSPLIFFGGQYRAIRSHPGD